MKKVAVSQRIEVFVTRNEKRDGLDQKLINFLLQAGFIPYPVPNTIDNYLNDLNEGSQNLITWLTEVNPDAIVLSGGNDLEKFKDRDTTEKTLLEYALALQLPLLGICRGMQMMGVWAGASLHPVQKHIKTRHKIYGEIMGMVNSYHAFSLARCPNEYEVIAYSEDNEIEAIRNLSLPWEGWMWHPEREKLFLERDINRIKNLFNNKTHK